MLARVSLFFSACITKRECVAVAANFGRGREKEKERDIKGRGKKKEVVDFERGGRVEGRERKSGRVCAGYGGWWTVDGGNA